jgi:hypothetical protein
MNILRIMPGNLRAEMEIEKLFSGKRHSGIVPDWGKCPDCKIAVPH